MFNSNNPEKGWKYHLEKKIYNIVKNKQKGGAAGDLNTISRNTEYNDSVSSLFQFINDLKTNWWPENRRVGERAEVIQEENKFTNNNYV